MSDVLLRTGSYLARWETVFLVICSEVQSDFLNELEDCSARHINAVCFEGFRVVVKGRGI